MSVLFRYIENHEFYKNKDNGIYQLIEITENSERMLLLTIPTDSSTLFKWSFQEWTGKTFVFIPKEKLPKWVFELLEETHKKIEQKTRLPELFGGDHS